MKLFISITLFFFLCFRAGAQHPAPGQPVYQDKAYGQKFSIQYRLAEEVSPGSRNAENIGLRKVFCDRNGAVQIYSAAGLVRPSGGALLYPGRLVTDIGYRPLRDMKIRDMSLYENQFVYATDQAVLSNAWAGKLYLKHRMPGVKFLCGGADFSFLISDGHSLQYLKDSTVVWEGHEAETVIDILFDEARNLFWILGGNSIATFSAADLKFRVRYKRAGLTCFTLSGNRKEILTGTHNGYFILRADDASPAGDLQTKLPCTDLTVVRIIDGKTWFGSVQGAFMLRGDGKFDYYASRRWVPSDKIADIAQGPKGEVLLLTDQGLAEIHFQPMTLYEKAQFFEKQVRERHIRNGFNATVTHMRKGDPETGSLEDSDNDGLWTAMYLGGEVFRYAVTHSPEALQNCRESLDALERLFTINPIKGFPARSFERKGYAASDTLVWKHAADSGWDWKSTTSSDEAIGHMFVYGAIAELVDDPAMKRRAIHLMDILMQHIVDHDMYLVDWDGKPTRWARWNPEYVNARSPNVGDRKITSSNIISMLQTAWHFTHKEVYRKKAFELMQQYGYLNNLMRPMKDIGEAPADADALSKELSDGWNHSDDEMYFLGYWGLYRYAFNDILKAKFKASILDHWQAERPEKEAAWDIATAMTGVKDFDLNEAVNYLKRYPLDLINWQVTNSRRKDISFIAPNFRRQTIAEVLPPDELPINRHNANLFELDGGDEGGSEYSAGDIWLLPYWMGRYFGVISGPEKQQ